jgi:anti-anti-sigma regulatory factor
MATKSKNSEHHLSGDWTISGVVTQVDLLSQSLEKLTSTSKKRVRIDCGKINAIDMSGLQLLHVWMELVKMRGVEAQLLNLPEDMQHTIHRLGLGHSFTDNYPDAA